MSLSFYHYFSIKTYASIELTFGFDRMNFWSKQPSIWLDITQESWVHLQLYAKSPGYSLTGNLQVSYTHQQKSPGQALNWLVIWEILCDVFLFELVEPCFAQLFSGPRRYNWPSPSFRLFFVGGFTRTTPLFEQGPLIIILLLFYMAITIIHGDTY